MCKENEYEIIVQIHIMDVQRADPRPPLFQRVEIELINFMQYFEGNIKIDENI